MSDKNEKDFLDDDSVKTRSELKQNKPTKNKKKSKKSKVEDDPDFQQFLKEDVKSEDVIKGYKKKKRKRNAILFVVCLLALVSAGAGTYYYLYDTKLQEEETIMSLERSYPEVFVDEEKTEIISNLPAKQYNHIKEMFDKTPNGTEKIEFTKYQTVLDEQFTNQQAAKKSIKALKTEDGKYLKEDVNQEMFDKAYELVKAPFNKEYMAQLTLEIDDLHSEFEKVAAVQAKVNGFYKDGVLQEYSAKDWEKLKIEIAELKNPTLKETLQAQYDTSYEEWTVREKERAAQKAKEEEEARKAAEEKAIKDAEEAAVKEQAEQEARELAEELERIKEEARLKVEAEIRAEQEAKEKEEAEKTAEAEKKIGANKIGIDGTFKQYISLGSSTNTETVQASIDAGNIVSSLSTFNGNDGQTTYFGGHNPGPFAFLESAISIGSVVTITDSSGAPTKYKMVEKVDTDVEGQDVIQTTGQTAIDLYLNGSGTESILIQFCNTSGELMSYWYGIKQ